MIDAVDAIDAVDVLQRLGRDEERLIDVRAGASPVPFRIPRGV